MAIHAVLPRPSTDFWDRCGLMLLLQLVLSIQLRSDCLGAGSVAFRAGLVAKTPGTLYHMVLEPGFSSWALWFSQGSSLRNCGVGYHLPVCYGMTSFLSQCFLRWFHCPLSPPDGHHGVWALGLGHPFLSFSQVSALFCHLYCLDFLEIMAHWVRK